MNSDRNRGAQIPVGSSVTDWATDFDFLDPQWIENPHPIWDALRSKCPIAHTDRFMGVYLPTRYADVRAIALDTGHFSSRRAILREGRPPVPPAPPITSDPPAHQAERNILVPFFTAEAIARYEPRTRAMCRELIKRLSGKNGCDAAADYASIPLMRIIRRQLPAGGSITTINTLSILARTPLLPRPLFRTFLCSCAKGPLFLAATSSR
jgi:cytochrome P450